MVDELYLGYSATNGLRVQVSLFVDEILLT